MDWFSWLSKSNLDPSLSYEYALAFARNELQKEDLVYFNHEFLQSMGVSVAKHRLEILKLARKEVGAGHNSLSKLFLSITKTKKRVTKYIGKWVSHENSPVKTLPEPARYSEQLKGALTRQCRNEKDLLEVEKPVVRTRRVAKSGPLDRKVQEKLMPSTHRSLKLSGPLDRNLQERLVFAYRSPVLSGPIDGRSYERLMFTTSKSPKLLSGPVNGRPPSPSVYRENHAQQKLGAGGDDDDDDHTLWASLFQDLKPT